MLKKIGTLAIFSATFLGLTTTVNANEVINQTSSQEATIAGNNNQVTQIIYQTNVPGRGLSKPRSNGRGRGSQHRSQVVQGSFQTTEINGNNNAVDQQTIQNNRGNRVRRGWNKR